MVIKRATSLVQVAASVAAVIVCSYSSSTAFARDDMDPDPGAQAPVPGLPPVAPQRLPPAQAVRPQQQQQRFPAADGTGEEQAPSQIIPFQTAPNEPPPTIKKAPPPPPAPIPVPAPLPPTHLDDSAPPPAVEEPAGVLLPEMNAAPVPQTPPPAQPEGTLAPPALPPRPASPPAPPAVSLPPPRYKHVRAPLAWRAKACELASAGARAVAAGAPAADNIKASRDYAASSAETFSALVKACRDLGLRVEDASSAARQLAVRCNAGDRTEIIFAAAQVVPGKTSVFAGLYPDSRSSRLQAIDQIFGRVQAILDNKGLL